MERLCFAVLRGAPPASLPPARWLNHVLGTSTATSRHGRRAGRTVAPDNCHGAHVRASAANAAGAAAALTKLCIVASTIIVVLVAIV